MIVAVIPIKRLGDAKSRLAHRLSERQRSDLVTALLRHTLDVTRASGLFARTSLVTPEVGLGAAFDVGILPDGRDLNSGLHDAAAWSLHVGADGLVILPGDLPLLTVNDLHALTSARAAGVSITRTSDGGTGALYLVPPGCIEPSFGPESFERHVELARAAGLPVRTVQRDGLAFDLDTPEDLDRARRLGAHLLPDEEH